MSVLYKVDARLPAIL